MGRKFEKASGRISLRVSVETHERIAAIADGLGTDVTSTINMMLKFGINHFEKIVLLLQTEIRPVPADIMPVEYDA